MSCSRPSISATTVKQSANGAGRHLKERGGVALRSRHATPARRVETQQRLRLHSRVARSAKPRRPMTNSMIYPVRHRVPVEGYPCWPFRWAEELEAGDAVPARAGALRAEPQSASQAKPLVSIARGAA